MKQYGELPQRADNHIRETSGYKILEENIPSNWIIRDVTERDYGIDCYIELVNSDNRLTGEIAFIQMKTTDKINWRKSDNGFKFYNVDKSTTNYLNGFKIPTYLFLVDLSTKELFFLPIKEYIIEHYDDDSKSGTFAYDFSHDNNVFSVDSFKRSFRNNNLYDQFRNELQYFISNMHQYINFMWEHNNRDCFMQIEKQDMLFFEAMHRNISFLQSFFITKNSITPTEVLSRIGIAKYGEPYEQTLFEGVITDMFNEFERSVLELVDVIFKLITEKERHYWMMEGTYIFNYFINLDKSELFK